MQISKNIFPNRIPALHIPKVIKGSPCLHLRISSQSGRFCNAEMAPNFTFKFPRTRDSQQHVQPINENGIADILLAVQPSKKDISGVMK
ncbi:hypothetical protein I7I53_00244 [Histoplasma capsulatum var. duboisii H88]|uniref:Uncharacterized protein n=1 Tax=Ajellomyces capsulatus (strain H88) TaxID=544711 RepID=A0A8A1LHV5_AJEC8|nr:hypothetical protein I7I53_00244 [Histoplasma capsulatum var. duboisii H88]